MNIIVTVDNNWAIGRNDEMLVRIPEEQKSLREETVGKVLVMGRKTLENMPGGQPLYGRTNIVLTQNRDYKAKGVTVLHSFEEALEELKKYKDEDIYILGGESLYKQFLPYCDTVHVTKIDYAYDANVYFPNLDEQEGWSIEESSDERTYFDLEYYFYKYVNKNRKDF